MKSKRFKPYRPKMLRLAISLPDDIVTRLDKQCAKHDMSRREMIRQMVMHCLNSND